MKTYFQAAIFFTTLSCQHPSTPPIEAAPVKTLQRFTPVKSKEGSWQHFLQNLPMVSGKIVDYRGIPVRHQEKGAAIVNFDIGTKDLQQCADALIRLRAEYLFTQKRYSDIRFQFTSGQLYTFADYCYGIRPVPNGRQVTFALIADAQSITPKSLRQYLDIVYAYAGTISLTQELKATDTIAIGTVIIKAGSPGHCSIVIDEATTTEGEKVYKLAEGFSPAQSIYVLKDPATGTIWQKLQKGRPIQTASYRFSSYQLRCFE